MRRCRISPASTTVSAPRLPSSDHPSIFTCRRSGRRLMSSNTDYFLAPALKGQDPRVEIHERFCANRSKVATAGLGPEVVMLTPITLHIGYANRCLPRLDGHDTVAISRRLHHRLVHSRNRKFQASGFPRSSMLSRYQHFCPQPLPCCISTIARSRNTDPFIALESRGCSTNAV